MTDGANGPASKASDGTLVSSGAADAIVIALDDGLALGGGPEQAPPGKVHTVANEMMVVSPRRIGLFTTAGRRRGDPV